MAKRINYAALYTLRKDGRYMGTYSDETGRHYVYDRDPETLYRKIQDLTVPKEETTPTFGQVADEWEREHREEIEPPVGWFCFALFPYRFSFSDSKSTT